MPNGETQRIAELEKRVAAFGKAGGERVVGTGRVVLAGKELIVDRTVHLSTIINRILALERRSIATALPLSGGGNLTADRTLELELSQNFRQITTDEGETQLDLADIIDVGGVRLNDSVFNRYSVGSFTITYTGYGTNPTGTAGYLVLGTTGQSIDGSIVLLFLPALSGTSNSSAFGLSGIPEGIRPHVIQHKPVVCINNANPSMGTLLLNTVGGQGTFYHNEWNGTDITLNATGWSNTGTKGTYGQVIAYATQ